MADINSDDDPDSAAMAEAMGFSGFGMQRTARKRKLTPPSQTGANNAPLGKRRPLNLPQPVVSGAGDGDDGGGNPEEIDLDDDDGGDVGAGTGGEMDGGDAGAAAPLSALTVSDAPPMSGPQHHHSLPARPPQQQQSHHGANNSAPRVRGRPGGGPGQTPWWEGEWDPRLVSRMIENPWERLEKQRGLGALGTWPSTARGTAAAHGKEEGDVSSIGGAVLVEQTAAQATVS